MLILYSLINLEINMGMKLLEQFEAACRTMNFAAATETCYRDWIVDFLKFHRQPYGTWVHHACVARPGVVAYLSELAVRYRLSASSQSQAMCALVFLYKMVLRQPLGRIASIRCKRPACLLCQVGQPLADGG